MTLPLLVSVPHAGTEVPEPARAACRLTHEEVVADGDVGAAEIYDISGEVTAFVTTPVARAILDMNRAVDDRRKDGVVKTHTCWDVPVWDGDPPAEVVTWLLEEHHGPYHAALSKGAPGVVLGLDAHTMAAQGPPVGPDPGVERPAACLSNAEGTCPRDWIEGMAEELARELGRPVSINDPFQGGYITRSHAAERPWMQLELSRAPYLSDADKRRAVLAALRGWCRRFA